MKIRKAKTTILCLSLMLSWMLLTGGIFNTALVTLDTKNNVVYQNRTFDSIAADFEGDLDKALEKYNNKYYAVRGRVGFKNEDNNGLTLRCVDINRQGRLECSTNNKNVAVLIKELKPGDNVVVYGKLSVSIFKEDLQLSIDGVSRSDKELPPTTYSLKNGKSIDTGNMETKTLKGGKIEYRIPADWIEVEHNIKEEGLGTMEGYQYCLNEISGSASVKPESFFVCYFDNNQLSDQNDRKLTDSIERTIAANILNKDVSKLKTLPSKRVTTYYGAKYQYYDDKYNNQIGEGYHTEFVFEQDGSDGIVVYIYIYKDKNHMDDIFFVMNMLDIK